MRVCLCMCVHVRVCVCMYVCVANRRRDANKEPCGKRQAAAGSETSQSLALLCVPGARLHPFFCIEFWFVLLSSGQIVLTMPSATPFHYFSSSTELTSFLL